MNLLNILGIRRKSKPDVTIKITGRVDLPNNEVNVCSNINIKEITTYKFMYLLSKGVELVLESVADKTDLPIDILKSMLIENLQKEPDNE